MVLWLLFAVMAAAVVWAVTRPLLSPGAVDATADSELAVYRDQLAEIEAERTQGLLGGAEAEGARIELARRLLRRAEEKRHAEAARSASSGRLRQLAIYSAAALPVVGIALYLGVGSPQLPSRPYAARLDAPTENATAADLVAKVEAHLRANPEDGRGWDVLAPVYMRLGNFTQAADAFQRAARLLGESPKRLAGFARALIMVQNGVVSEPVRQAYERLKALEPDNIEPQVWLAIGREQDGDLKGAEAEYRKLLNGAQEPWRGLLVARLQSASEKLGTPMPEIPPATAPAAGSAADSIAAMSPAERDKRIAEMVEGLSARLKQNGNDLEGWMRLVRSYVVLGRRDDAVTALSSARGQFSGDDKSLAELNVLAESLGLGS